MKQKVPVRMRLAAIPVLIAAAACDPAPTAKVEQSAASGEHFESSRCQSEYRASRFSEAASACESLAQGSVDPRAEAFAALSLLQLGEYDRAVTFARNGAKFRKGKPRAAFLALEACVLLAKGEDARAGALADFAVSGTDPPLMEALLTRARIKFIRSDSAASKADAEHAARLNPTDPNPASMLGYLRLAEQLDQEAILQFEEALRLDPKHVRAYIYLAALGKRPAVRPEASNPWDEQLLSIAGGEASAGTAVLAGAAGTDGKHAKQERLAEVHLILGLFAESARNVDDARTHYRDVLATNARTMDVRLATLRMAGLEKAESK